MSTNDLTNAGISRNDELQPKWKNEKLESKYRCSSCDRYLRHPIKSENCGHYICSSCLPEIMSVSSRCPSCQQLISLDKIVDAKNLEKEIQMLEVYCTNKEKGCDWMGTLRDFQVHVELCEFLSIDCPNGCDAKFEKRFLSKHQNEDCSKRTILCEFCKTNMVFEEKISHSNVCAEFKISCPNQCSTQEFPRGQIQNHLDIQCSKQQISCPFKDCGCDYRDHRAHVIQHIKDLPGIHLNMSGKTISIQKQLLKLLEEKLIEQENYIDLLTQRINALEKTSGAHFIWKIGHYHERTEEARTNKKSTLFSPPFLISRHGYCFALSVCLWGDGAAKGKYVSLFICICRGDYDALLAWPFSHRVTFTLLDQCEDVNNRRHIKFTVQPNVCEKNQPFLGRPTSDRNASFGCPKFVHLDTIKTLDYIKDDTIFIKVEIDTEQMIKI